jgi:DNA-binding protein H-NS
MAKTYAELSQEIESLKVRAEAARQKEKTGVIDRIRDAIAVYGLTADELGLGRNASGAAATSGKAPTGVRKQATGIPSSTKSDSAVKYRDESGNAWGGRGPKPKWLKAGLAAGRSLESFAVGKSPAQDSPAIEEGSASRRVKPGAKQGKKAKAAFKSVIKYRDDAGHAWSGRGPKPAWFTAAIESGKTVEQLTA